MEKNFLIALLVLDKHTRNKHTDKQTNTNKQTHTHTHPHTPTHTQTIYFVIANLFYDNKATFMNKEKGPDSLISKLQKKEL